jgi:cation transport ATPase
VLGVLGLSDSFFKLGFLKGEIFISVLTILLVAILLLDHKTIASHQLSSRLAEVNLLEVFGIVAAIAFNLFIFYSAIGEGDAFLRSDMYMNAYTVAFLTKFGGRKKSFVQF